MLKMRAAAVKLRERNAELETSIRRHRQDAEAPRYSLDAADSTDDEDWYFPTGAGAARLSASVTEIFDLGADTGSGSGSDTSDAEAEEASERGACAIRQTGFDFGSVCPMPQAPVPHARGSHAAAPLLPSRA